MRRGWILVCLCAVAIWGGGCAGYKLGPTNGEIAGAHSIQIDPLVNKTLEPRLGDYVMNSLRKNLQRDGTYRLDTRNEGDIILSGVITTYTRVGISVERTDVITVQDYEIVATAQMTAKDRATGKVLFEKPVTGRTILRAGADLTSSERQAIPLLADDLAQRLAADAHAARRAQLDVTRAELQ